MTVFNSPRVKVAVLRGGPSDLYDASLKTGNHILSELREMRDTYEPVDIFISKKGDWHRDGLVTEPHAALRHLDFAWNALHDQYGEDGKVQQLLESLNVPFTGSGSLGAALSMNKDMSKKFYTRYGIPTPTHVLIDKDNIDENVFIEIFTTYMMPVVVKPVDKSGSVGLKIAHTLQEIKDAVKNVFNFSNKAMVEEFVRGDVVNCAVVENARGEKLYAFLPFSESRLRTDENKKIEDFARKAHEILGLRHYSSSDFIVTPKRNIYILETNALPIFHEDSPMYKSLEATGWRSRDLINHIISLASNG